MRQVVKQTKAWWTTGGNNPYGDTKSVKKTPIRDFMKKSFASETKKSDKPLESNAPWVKEKNWMEKSGIPNTC